MLFNDYARLEFSAKASFLNVHHVTANIENKKTDFVKVHGYVSGDNLDNLLCHFSRTVVEKRKLDVEVYIKVSQSLLALSDYVRHSMKQDYFPCVIDQSASSIGLPSNKEISAHILGERKCEFNSLYLIDVAVIKTNFVGLLCAEDLEFALGWWSSFISFFSEWMSEIAGEVYNSLSLFYITHESVRNVEQTHYLSMDCTPVFVRVTGMHIDNAKCLLSAFNYTGDIMNTSAIINEGINGTAVMVDVQLYGLDQDDESEQEIRSFKAVVNTSELLSSSVMSMAVKKFGLNLIHC